MKNANLLRGVMLMCVIALFVFLTTGCAKKTKAPLPGAMMKFRIAVVTDTGGVGDKSFNEGAWRGAQKAASELGLEAKLVESREQADYARNLRELARAKYDLIFAVGMLMKDAVKEIAPEFPNTKFAIIDTDSMGLPNVIGVEFKEQEGGYLAGVLAGLMTKSGKIGFVGGMKLEPVKRFCIGYEAGARTVRPDIKVISGYCDNFTDVEKGKQFAAAQFDAGADIVFHGAGRCGLGVIEEAKERGKGYWAIGVDSDQDYLGTKDPSKPQPPGRVLTTVLKRVDNAVLQICGETSKGKFKAGDRRFGVADHGLALTEMKYSKGEIPQGVLRKVMRAETMLNAGEIKVPSTEDELKAFKPPAL